MNLSVCLSVYVIGDLRGFDVYDTVNAAVTRDAIIQYNAITSFA